MRIQFESDQKNEKGLRSLRDIFAGDEIQIRSAVERVRIAVVCTSATLKNALDHNCPGPHPHSQ